MRPYDRYDNPTKSLAGNSGRDFFCQRFWKTALLRQLIKHLPYTVDMVADGCVDGFVIIKQIYGIE